MLNLRKIRVRRRADGIVGPHCSFCGEEIPEGTTLITGPEASICDECLGVCNDLVAADTSEDDSPEDADEADATGEQTQPARQSVFFRVLTEAEVTSLVSMDDLIDAMGEALRRFSSGEVVQPMRTVLALPEPHTFFGLMPAYVREPGVLGAKLVSVFGRNAALDLPTHLASILLFSPQTGALVALMDGRYITEARTAAVSAVSADLLAREDASVMAILGSGVQARSHLEAMDRIFELAEVRVYSPTADHQLRFIEEMAPTTTARLVGTDSAEEAVRRADLIVLATSSPTPVVESDWIESGAHVVCVGACRPDQREMDPALVQRGRLFVDSRASALLESGDIVLGIKDGLFKPSHIVGEIGELLAGNIEGRRSPRDLTIFKSLGLAIEDLAAADLVYRRAVERNAGVEIAL